MAHELILIVEDDEDILELLQVNLSRAGYDTETALSGEEALRKLSKFAPDLILLDLMLPGVDGYEVCRRVRADETLTHVPIVMLTARGEEADIVKGLESGADDYITKPFSPGVLKARIAAVLRRSAGRKPGKDDVIRISGMVIHPGRREVLVRNEPVKLTYSEFSVLHFLASRPGWVFTRYQIVDAVHGEDYPVTERSVDVQIVGLRRKLGAAGQCIETVRGVGYRFREEDED